MTEASHPVMKSAAMAPAFPAGDEMEKSSKEKKRMASPLSMFARRLFAGEAATDDSDEGEASEAIAGDAATAESTDVTTVEDQFVPEVAAEEALAEPQEPDSENEAEAEPERLQDPEPEPKVEPAPAPIAAKPGKQPEQPAAEPTAHADEATAPFADPEEVIAQILARNAVPVPKKTGLETYSHARDAGRSKDSPVEMGVAEHFARRASRLKTIFLGFERSTGKIEDAVEPQERFTAEPDPAQFTVGWIIVIEGPGRGTSFTLHPGLAKIGRGEDQDIQLNFGDTGISRSHHASIAYDDEEDRFFLGQGGKKNIVRLNGRPVLSTEPIENGDKIRIGETTLKFVALCGPDFTWKR